MFDARATAAALPYDRLVPAIALAALDLRAGRIHAAARGVLPLPDGGTYLAMPCADARYAVCKLVSVNPANRARELPTLHAVVVVGDASTGAPLALLDGPTLTARRTAAVTMLGIETIRGSPPQRVALVGTGAQALTHARAMSERWPGLELRCVGRTIAQAAAFVGALAADGVRATAQVVDAALRDADVVVAATTSRTAVLPSPIADATLVVGIGSFTPEMAELPASEIRRRSVIVDDLDGARREAGDLLQADVDWTRVRPLAELLDPPIVLTGPLLLKTVGHAAWDMAAVRVAIGGDPDR